jgi:hypothetical protein
MAIPGLESLGLSGFSPEVLFGKVLLGLQIVGGFLVVGILLYFFVIKRRKYKDKVIVYDVRTNTMLQDKGYLKRNRDGTQEYVLKKAKDAKLESPTYSTFTTKKGKRIAQVVKYGSGDYNWANLDEQWDRERKGVIKEFRITNLTDENWTKDKIKRAAEKKAKKEGFVAYIPQIMIGAVIVMFIISAYYLSGVMKQTVTTGGSVLGQANSISDKLADVAKTCNSGGGYNPPYTDTPPGV